MRLQAATTPRLLPSAAPASLHWRLLTRLAIMAVLFWNTSLLSLNIMIYWVLTLYQKHFMPLISFQPHHNATSSIIISILPSKDWSLLVTGPHHNSDFASLLHTLWVPPTSLSPINCKFKEKEVMRFLVLTASLHCPYNVIPIRRRKFSTLSLL